MTEADWLRPGHALKGGNSFALIAVASDGLSTRPHERPVVSGYGSVEFLGMLGRGHFGDRRFWDCRGGVLRARFHLGRRMSHLFQ